MRQSRAKAPTTVEQAIIKPDVSLYWGVRVDKLGLIIGTLNLRTHTAIVNIPDLTSNFSSLYKESANLDQKGSVIHPNYNGWTSNLEQAIQRQWGL